MYLNIPMYVYTFIHINIGLGWNCCCMMGGEEFVCYSAGEKGAELLKDRVSKTLLKGAESQSTRCKWFVYFFNLFCRFYVCPYFASRGSAMPIYSLIHSQPAL